MSSSTTCTYFAKHPLEIFLPFEFSDGVTFTGISGMSYHGGVIGILDRGLDLCPAAGLALRDMADLYVPAIPLGYTFGRLGNFINGELYGRVTTAPIGMYFPLAPDKALRHPSQLYEAFFEGIFLFLVMWSIRKVRAPRGAMLAFYLIGYGVVRFVIEFFREPDAHLGPVVAWVSMGQVLCAGMIAAGVVLYLYLRQRPDASLSEARVKAAVPALITTSVTSSSCAARPRNRSRAFEDRLQDALGRFVPVRPHDVHHPILAERLPFRVLGFPDPVRPDQHDVAGPEPRAAVPAVDACRLHPERHPGPAQFLPAIRPDAVQQARVVAGPHPLQASRAGVDLQQKQGDEAAARGRVGAQQPVDVAHLLGHAARPVQAAAQQGTHGRHQQGGRDPVADHVADRGAQPAARRPASGM